MEESCSITSDVALNCDLLSSLPDSLLLHIFSFLDMKDAVLTSILSKRWRSLWTFVPDLSFNVDCYEETDDPDSNFINFVDRSLILHLCSNINKFCVRFVFDKNKYDSHLDAWIRFAMSRRVRELDLHLFASDSDHYKLPSWFFQSDTLTSLKLKICKAEVPDFVHFSSLTSLSLWYVEFGKGSFQKLLNGCPLLEDLVLDDCVVRRRLVISSSSPSNPLRLKSLTVTGMTMRFGFKFEAPNLQMLKIYGRIYRDNRYFLNDILCLKEAHLVLHVKISGPGCSFDGILKYFLRKLCHAGVLKLNTECIQAIPLIRHVESYLLNTKCLILRTSLQECEHEGIAKLLEASPHIETLIIELTRVDKNRVALKRHGLGRRDYWESLVHPFPSMLSLKTIKITGFIGGKYESYMSKENMVTSFVEMQDVKIRLASFLLRNAELLEKMVVNMSKQPYSVEEEEWEKIKSVVAEKVMAVPRVSSRAHLLFL